MEKQTTEKLVDFIVKKIQEESDDYTVYAEWAANEAYHDAASQMKQIADDEKKHRDCLIKMLAQIAKEGAAHV